MLIYNGIIILNLSLLLAAVSMSRKSETVVKDGSVYNGFKYHYDVNGTLRVWVVWVEKT